MVRWRFGAAPSRRCCSADMCAMSFLVSSLAASATPSGAPESSGHALARPEAHSWVSQSFAHPAAPSCGARWGVETPDAFPNFELPGPLGRSGMGQPRGCPISVFDCINATSCLGRFTVGCKDMCLSSDSLSLQHAVGGGVSVSRTDRAAVHVRCVEVFGGPKVSREPCSRFPVSRRVDFYARGARVSWSACIEERLAVALKTCTEGLRLPRKPAAVWYSASTKRYGSRLP